MSSLAVCCSKFSSSGSCKCRENAKGDRGLTDSLLDISNEDPFFNADGFSDLDNPKPVYTIKKWEDNSEKIWFQKAFGETSSEPVLVSPKRNPNANLTNRQPRLFSMLPYAHIEHYRKTETEKNYSTKERYRLITSDFRYQQEFMQTIARLLRMENESPQKRRANSRISKLEKRNSRKWVPVLALADSDRESYKSRSSKESESTLGTNSTKRSSRGKTKEVEDAKESKSPSGDVKSNNKVLEFENDCKANFDQVWVSFPSFPSSHVTDISPTLTPDTLEKEVKAADRGGPSAPPPLLLPSIGSPTLSRSSLVKNRDEKSNISGSSDQQKGLLTSSLTTATGTSFTLSVVEGRSSLNQKTIPKNQTKVSNSKNWQARNNRSFSNAPGKNSCLIARGQVSRPIRSASSPRKLEELITVKSCLIQSNRPSFEEAPNALWPFDSDRYARARLQFAKLAKNNSKIFSKY